MTKRNARLKRSKNPQQRFFKSGTLRYGGDLLTKRKNRQSGRPLSTEHTMHLVLRSTQAVGDWSFKKHKAKIQQILEKFSARYGVKLKSMANVGNHLHIHIQLTNRHTYGSFIRAITAAIMMAVTGVSRWNKIELKKKFWDRRPFTRVIVGLKAMLTLRDYIKVNQLEGLGLSRIHARFYMAWRMDSSFESRRARLNSC